MAQIKAREQWLETWNGSGTRARHDYDCPEHLLPEMLHDEYFGWIHHRFRRGDIVFATDAASNRATFIIEDVETTFRKVQFSILRTHSVLPVTKPGETKDDPGLTVRFRGPRGGNWCIVDGQDTIVDSGHRTKIDAQKALDVLIEKRKAA